MKSPTILCLFFLCCSLSMNGQGNKAKLFKTISKAKVSDIQRLVSNTPELLIGLSEPEVDSLVYLIKLNLPGSPGLETIELLKSKCQSCNTYTKREIIKTKLYYDAVLHYYSNRSFMDKKNILTNTIDSISLSKPINNNDKVSLYSLNLFLGFLHMESKNFIKSRIHFDLAQTYQDGFCFYCQIYSLSSDVLNGVHSGFNEKFHTLLNDVKKEKDELWLSKVYQLGVSHFLYTNDIDSAQHYINLIPDQFKIDFPELYLESMAEFYAHIDDKEKELELRKEILNHARSNADYIPNTVVYELKVAELYLELGLLSDAYRQYDQALAKSFYIIDNDTIILDEVQYAKCLIGKAHLSALKSEFGPCGLYLDKARDFINSLLIGFDFNEKKFDLIKVYHDLTSIYIKFSDQLKIKDHDLLMLSEKSKALSLMNEFKQRESLKRKLSVSSFDSLRVLQSLSLKKSLEIDKAYAGSTLSKETIISNLLKEKSLLSRHINDIVSSIDNSNYQYSSVKNSSLDYKNYNGSIVEYFVTPGVAVVFLINNNTLKVFRLTLPSSFEILVSEYISLINNPKSKESFRSFSKQIFSLVFEDIYPHLEKEVLIIPHGVLSSLPFESLINKEEKYLVEQFDISYSYSLSVLNEMKTVKSSGTKFLGFAPSYAQLPRLFANSEELKSISKGFKSSLCFFDDTAVKSNFINNSSNYNLIHIASHADINPLNNDYSYIAFSEKNVNNESDYLLYLNELETLDLNSEMIVLSACNTSIGRFREGAGILSLAKGFVSAGTASVVSTLWEVDDLATSELMISFYKNLTKGQTKSAALANAKRSYLKSGFRVHPYYWSSFIPVGDMKPICNPNNGIKYVFYGLLFLGLLFFFLKQFPRSFSFVH